MPNDGDVLDTQRQFWEAQEREREQYAKEVAERAGRIEPVTPVEVEHARLQYIDQLIHLRDRAENSFAVLPESHRVYLDLLRLTYEALQRRLTEQQREAEAEEASRVIASNTELAKRQTTYAKIVMWVVIAQTVFGIVGVAAAVVQAFK